MSNYIDKRALQDELARNLPSYPALADRVARGEFDMQHEPLLPTQAVPVQAQHAARKQNRWYWPVISLVGLLIVVLGGTVAALVF
jgi:hypothetical protein